MHVFSLSFVHVSVNIALSTDTRRTAFPGPLESVATRLRRLVLYMNWPFLKRRAQFPGCEAFSMKGRHAPCAAPPPYLPRISRSTFERANSGDGPTPTRAVLDASRSTSELVITGAETLNHCSLALAPTGNIRSGWPGALPMARELRFLRYIVATSTREQR